MALSGDWTKTGLFLVYQFPFILPMAIPISALIASLLLFQRLSQTGELTALRASGISLKNILAPLLFASLLLSVLNFSISSEIAPYCKRASKTLLYRETSQNPLLLLQRQQLVKLKNAYLKIDVEEDGKIAKNVNLIAYNESNQRLSLFSAKELRMLGEELHGNDLAIISHLHSEKEEIFDPLVIENQACMLTDAPALSSALKKNRPNLEVSSLNLRMLRAAIEDGQGKGGAARVEIFRRLSLSLAVFSFTLLGCAFGITTGRNPSKKGLLCAIVLALAILLTYLLGKELKKYLLLALLTFLLPHPLIWVASSLRLRRISKGCS